MCFTGQQYQNSGFAALWRIVVALVWGLGVAA